MKIYQESLTKASQDLWFVAQDIRVAADHTEVVADKLVLADLHQQASAIKARLDALLA